MAALGIRGEAMREHHGDAALAAAVVAAERERLAENQPALAGKAMLDDGAAEDKDVDARVAPSRGGVLGHGERAWTADVPQGCTQGRRPAEGQAMDQLRMPAYPVRVLPRP